MEYIIGLLQFLSGKDFSVPLWEVLLLVMTTSACLLLGRHKLGLIVSYLFVFYWGFIFNSKYFLGMVGESSWGLYIYVICGVVMALVFIVGFFVHK
ncbi:MAG TPA: hypothetical protein VMT62_17905 [Syntrophorhabdaceae bacterium]|nr:hypothetical protein [Syntrophorhabdaceae bacterium]